MIWLEILKRLELLVSSEYGKKLALFFLGHAQAMGSKCWARNFTGAGLEDEEMGENRVF